ncbi:MAG: phosphoglucosamine mutase [Bacteroidales bacterium]
MSLIKSISGIRGTIGGDLGNSLTPIDIVKFTAAYAVMLSRDGKNTTKKVVVGRDARISGEMVDSLVCGTLIACGVDVVNIGLATTPTTEMAVVFEKADGGIILTASHNPKQWNALKLLNSLGEFFSAEQAADLLDIVDKEEFLFADVDSLGHISHTDYTQKHIDAVINNELVDLPSIRNAHFKVVIDAINSVGGIVMPKLFEALGVECVKLNCEPTGDFAHNPEPLAINLVGLSDAVVSNKADLGVSVDPDVDRLVFICEDGTPFVEEYTLVAVADYVLSHKKGSTVSNLSSSRALKDVTEAHGCTYTSAAVGEVNVTTQMRRVGAVIGGEGNGGVIFPELHYGRDALIGVALFLSHLAHKKMKVSELKATYPQYVISKNRIELSDTKMIDDMLLAFKNEFKDQRITDIDGVRVDFDKEKMWVHLRKSNTEPIIRIISEAKTKEQAEELAAHVKMIADRIMKK